MSKRVTYMRVPKGSRLQGVYKETEQYLVEGQAANTNEGGGKIGRVEFAGGFLYIRKVNDQGKPHRDFGTVAISGGRKLKLEADGIAVSAEGFALLFNDEVDQGRQGK